MRYFKALCASLALCWGAGTFVQAQTVTDREDVKVPRMFFGVQGGVQTTFTNYDLGKLITPHYAVYFGGNFNPIVGARLHVSGFQDKGGIRVVERTYDFKSVTTSADVLLNLTNLFSRSKDHAFNVILVGGVGLNCAWDNDEAKALAGANGLEAWDDRLFSHNARVGVLLDWAVTRRWGLNLELTANDLTDRFNSKRNGNDDWKAVAHIGLNYKFGNRRAKKEEPVVVEEEWATRIDTVWYDDVSYKDVVEEVRMEQNFYYDIRMSDPEPQSKVESIVDFVNSHKNCKIMITAYADKATGTPKVNMRYSRERAEKVVQALIDAGVPKACIAFEYKGDTVQPFADNDLNRLAVVIVTGQGNRQEKVVSKKFRTKETRYRVN